MTGAMRIRLTLRPVWSSVEVVREAVMDGARAAFDNEVAEALAMISAELLENAVKYGDAAGPIRFTLDRGHTEAIVTVTNLLPEDADLAPLLARLSLLGDSSAGPALYEARLREIADQRTHGGLGILRVAAHGNCFIEADTSERGLVTIRARCS
jgi:two-component sensor histidine kinase